MFDNSKKILGGHYMTSQQLSAIAKSYLYAFPKTVSNLQCPKHLHFISNKIQNKLNIKSEKYQLLMVSVPPRFGKSLLISKHFIPWFLGNNPRKRVILTSYSAELSDQNSDYAKDIFAKWGPILFDVEPSPNLYNRSAWNTKLGGGVISAGIDGSITGFGADLFVIDDYIKGDEQAESKTQRDKIWSKWQSVVATRLHPNSLTVILATRWSDDDLIGRIVAQADREGREDFPFDYEYINLPAIAEENDPLGRKPGEPLWPKRYSKKRLENIKRIVGPYWWEALYQGNPVARGGNLFKKEFFRYYERDKRTSDYLCYRLEQKEPIRIYKNSLKIAVTVDPALEEKKKNDPTGMLAWGYSKKHKVWLLLDRFNGRIPHQRAVSIILNFAFKNNAKEIFVENEKIGKVLKKQSEGNDEIGGIKIPFKEVPSKGQDKFIRATPMASYCENERVFFPKDAIYLAVYERNLTTFPSGAEDEDVDCTSYAQHMEKATSIADALAQK